MPWTRNSAAASFWVSSRPSRSPARACCTKAWKDRYSLREVISELHAMGRIISTSRGSSAG
ncbi:hypothetical protein SUDANB120_05489 [Streptomyces sp. enrichment culture]